MKTLMVVWWLFGIAFWLCIGFVVWHFVVKWW